MLKKFILIVLVFFCCLTNLYADSELRALWVECEGSNDTLSSKKKVDAMLDRVKELNFNAIFVQIYRANRAWYDSDIADNTPFRDFKKREGLDLLQYIITQAHKRGIQVHAWANILRVARNINANIFKELGKDIINVDSRGRSLLAYKDFKLPPPEDKYYTLGTAGYWLDAGNLQLQAYLLKLVREIVQKYPDLDGFHMDMIRNPYCVPYSPGSRFPQVPSFGWGKESVRRFKEKTGLNPFTMDLNTKNTMAWDDFRRDQVTSVVESIYKQCKQLNSKLNVSAAVLCWADRAYLSAFQDWRRWLEDKIVDSILVMNYSKDTRFVKYLSQQAISVAYDRQVYIGLGAYMLNKQEQELVKQVEDSRKLGAQGVALFSYDSLLLDKQLFTFLKKQLFSGKAEIKKLSAK